MPTDPNAQYVTQLKGSADWGGLIRYGLVHNLYLPAIEAAIEVLRGPAFGNDYEALRKWLMEFRENPLEPRDELEVESLGLRESEQIALKLVQSLPFIVLCETIVQFPADQQDPMLRIGKQTAELWKNFGIKCDDAALVAVALRFSARSLQELAELESAADEYSRALVAYRKLAISCPAIYLRDVAIAADNLGIVLANLNRFEEALESVVEAVAIRRKLAATQPEIYLPDVSIALTNLGGVQCKLLRLEDAVASFEESLTIWRNLADTRPEAYLRHVAMTLNNLGTVQTDLACFEEAVGSLEDALTIRRKLAETQPDTHLPDVAITLTNLGNVQNNLNRLEAAAASFEEALGILRKLAAARPEIYLRQMAMTLNNLGSVLNKLSLFEDAVASVNEAVSTCRQLAAARPEVYLPELASSLHNLGTIQSRLSRFEDAVATLEEALAIRRKLAVARPAVYVPDLAMTLNNLGTMQKELSRFEEAAWCYEEALTIQRDLAATRPDAYLQDLAMTLNNLGIVTHDLSRNEQAVAYFEEALAVRRNLASARPDICLPDVAMTLSNLGAVQSVSKRFDAIASLEEALCVYRKLAATRPNVYLPDVAGALNNLGTVQCKLSRFENAEASFEEALAVQRKLAATRPEVDLPDVAGTLNNLSNVHRNLQRFEDAVATLEEALRIYSELDEQFGTAQLLGRINLCQNYATLVLGDVPQQGWPDYGLARKLLHRASDLAEGFRGMFGDPRERIRVQQEQQRLYAQRVDVCLRAAELLDDPTGYEEALEAAEGGRSRAMLDALAQQVLPELAPLELKVQFSTLQRDLRRAQRRLHQELETLEALAGRSAPSDSLEYSPSDSSSSLQTPDDEADGESIRTDSNQNALVSLARPRRLRDGVALSQSLSLERDQRRRIELILREVQGKAEPYRKLIAQLKAVDPQFQPDRIVDSFRMENRRELFPQDKPTRYVYLQSFDDHYLAMILTHDTFTPIPIPEWSSKHIKYWTNALVVAQQGLNDIDMSKHMQELIPEVLSNLRPGLVHRLLPALQETGQLNGDRLILVPDELLSFLPLHGVPVSDDEVLGGCFEIAYVRSLSVLQQCLRRKRPAPTRLFAIVDPTRTLIGPSLEAELVRRHFPDLECLIECNHSALLSGASDAHVFHWMGHAQFYWEIPYWSGLLLRRSAVPPCDLATFTDIDCGLAMRECSLAILSGCQSGLGISGKGNEHVSLVSAFLNAGAKCVVASLWPVDDGACLLTIQRFLHAWRQEGQTISAALRTAQLWLRTLTAQQLAEWADSCPELQQGRFRDLKHNLRHDIAQFYIDAHGPDCCPYASPYFWAPFVAAGQTWPDEAVPSSPHTESHVKHD